MDLTLPPAEYAAAWDVAINTGGSADASETALAAGSTFHLEHRSLLVLQEHSEPEAEPDLQKLAREGSIEWIQREYRRGDLEATFIAIAATNDTDVNIAVYNDAERRAMLVNIVDVPPLCNFILPAIVRTGPLAIAISTAGASPALAKRMKAQIADTYGEPYARLAVLLNEVRGWAKGTLPTYQDRKLFFESIVNGEPDPVELLRGGDEAAVRDLIEAAQQTHQPA